MVLFFLAAGLVGCAPTADDEATGVLAVAWTVGPDGCDAAGVAEVAVHLDGTRVGSAACDSAATEVERLDAGFYALSVKGLDADGMVRYASEPTEVLLEADTVVDAGRQVLTALPATLEVSWYFANARLCANNEVRDVVVSVWDDGYLAAEAEVACDEGLAEVGGLPAGTYLAEVVGLDAQGEARFVGSAAIEVDKGDTHVVEVALDAE